MEQGTAEKLAALEYAQRHMNSLQSLQSNETTELDKFQPVCLGTTWLEDAKETVSFYKLPRVIIELNPI